MTRRAFIVHGYQSAPDRHWFPWLGQQLAAQGCTVVSIALPDSDRPDFQRWQQTLADHIGSPTTDDYFIAHSLGCITLLHYLSRNAEQALGGIVLAAGFSESIPTLPELHPYINQAGPDLTRLPKSTKIHHIISNNDSIIPPVYSHRLAEQLGGAVSIIPNGGHLMGNDGIHELPEALDALNTLFEAV